MCEDFIAFVNAWRSKEQMTPEQRKNVYNTLKKYSVPTSLTSRDDWTRLLNALPFLWVFTGDGGLSKPSSYWEENGAIFKITYVYG